MNVYLVQINASFCVCKTREVAETIVSNFKKSEEDSQTTSHSNVTHISEMEVVEMVEALE